MAGDLILGVGGECAVRGCGARLVGLSMELRYSIIADENTRLVLRAVSKEFSWLHLLEVRQVGVGYLHLPSSWARSVARDC